MTQTIVNSTSADMEEIFRLYGIAQAYQRRIGATVLWPDFERDLVETEVAELRQWKLLLDGEIACVWAITFSDEQIWQERNADSAVYIHRIATNPNFRGRNFVADIVSWAKEYALKMGKNFVRLDTLGENRRLIEHYRRSGFEFLGMFKLQNTDALPEHYQRGYEAALFELRVEA